MDELLEAVQEGVVDKVSRLLYAQPDIIAFRDENGRTLLSWAAQLGHIAIVQLLVEKGAEVNARDNDTLENGAPLHQAVEGNHTSIVKFLLEHGADVFAEAKNDRTPLHVLANAKAGEISNSISEEIFYLLMANGAKIDSVPIAATFGTLEDIKKLVAEGADVDDWLEPSERTALHIAVKENNIELLTYLVSVTKEINRTDLNGLTPVDIATKEEVEKILRSYGGKKNSEIWDDIYS